MFGRYLHDRGALDGQELRVLTRLAAVAGPAAASPDLLVVLRGDPRALLDRIGRRGRAGEESYTIEDLERMDVAYDDWSSRLSPSRMVEVDVVARDLRTDPEISWLAAETRRRLASAD